MKALLARLLVMVRSVLRPFNPLISGHEPQLVGFLVTAAASLLAHYNLHLTASQQTTFTLIVVALVHWAVRGLVTPVAALKPIQQVTVHHHVASNDAAALVPAIKKAASKR